MFKGFQNNRRSNGFNGFPNLNFQMNNEAYGFSGCTFWLDAAYGLNTQTDGAAVSSWTDKIKNIRFYNNTAAQQLLFNSSNANFNNLPTVQCNAYANKKLVSDYSVSIGSKTTIVVVYKNDNVNNLVPFLLTWNNSAFLATGGTAAQITGFGIYTGIGASAIFTSNVENTSSNIGIITNNEIYNNGVQQTTGTWISNQTFNSIGGDGSQFGSMIGRIAEIIIYNFSMSSSECVELSTRLNSKYAIY